MILGFVGFVNLLVWLFDLMFAGFGGCCLIWLVLVYCSGCCRLFFWCY